MDKELQERMLDFVEYFELVFQVDWYMTKDVINDEHYIALKGTFIEPGVADESNNWGNRGSLLSSYRMLKRAMHERGIHSQWE